MTRFAILACLLAMTACAPGMGGKGDGTFAPGVNRRAAAENSVDVGHRLIAAGEYELALRAFTRAALDRGETDAEILAGMGSANLGLGRLGQAEEAFRVALEKEGNWPGLWNNLGVVLMERGKTIEAEQVFHRAYAMDNGETDAIRDNLRLALSKKRNPDYHAAEVNNYKLVRRGSSDYLIRKTP